MGIDFIRSRGQSFLKGWDRRLVALATPDLFTRQPETMARTALADLIGDARLHKGEVVIVQPVGDSLVAMKGVCEVARFSSPPAELINAVNDGCCIARGTVQQVNDLSGTVEISLC